MRRVLIGGEWVEPASAGLREIRNPATLAPIDAVVDCGAEDVARAVRAARSAVAGWRDLAPVERAEQIARAGARIRERSDALARLVTQETGKPLCEAGDELAEVAACFDRAASAAAAAGAHARPRGGVAVVLGAFDRPVGSTAGPAAAAVAAGEAVVVKAPQENPLSTLCLAEAFDALPPGLLNVLTGARESAAALIRAEGVTRVVASGSRAVRAAVAAAAQAAGKTAEVDGDAVEAVLVLDDADLDLAVADAAWSGLRNAGQSGGSRVRLYAQRSVAAEFADRLHIHLAFLEVGDPSKPDTDLGPLISHEAARQAEEQVARALKDGARLKLGGRAFRPWGLPGHFFQPTLLSEARCAGLAARAEIPAPVLVIATVEDAREACADADQQGCRSMQIHTRDAGLAAGLIAARRAAGGAAVQVLERGAAWFPYRERR